MVLRHVQQLEIVMIIFHLGALDHLVAHAHKDVHHAIERDIHRVQRTGTPLRPGHRHIHRLGSQPRFLLARLKLRRALVQRFLKRLAHIVHQLTHLRPLLRRQLTHAAQQPRQLALLAQHAHANLLQAAGAPGLAQFRHYALSDLSQLLLHNRSSLSFDFPQGQNKKTPPQFLGRSLTPLYHPYSLCACRASSSR